MAVSVVRRPCAVSWSHVGVASKSCRPAGVAHVQVVRSMKQRGIASFFGAGKAENAPPTTKVASATPGKSAKTASLQQTAEVLKDVTSSGTKRAREVTRAGVFHRSQDAGCLHHMSLTAECLDAQAALVLCRILCRVQ